MEDFRERIISLEGKIDSLQDKVDGLHNAIWNRVEDYGKRLPVLEDRVSDLRRVGWLIMSTLLVQFVVAIWAVLVMKRG